MRIFISITLIFAFVSCRPRINSYNLVDEAMNPEPRDHQLEKNIIGAWINTTSFDTLIFENENKLKMTKNKMVYKYSIKNKKPENDKSLYLSIMICDTFYRFEEIYDSKRQKDTFFINKEIIDSVKCRFVQFTNYPIIELSEDRFVLDLYPTKKSITDKVEFKKINTMR